MRQQGGVEEGEAEEAQVQGEKARARERAARA
jgi:hypothetical protein